MLTDIHTHKKGIDNHIYILNLKPEDANFKALSREAGLFSTGIHPWDINKFLDSGLKEIENCISDKRFVAVGECGFDKNINVLFENQKDVFLKQVTLSEKYKKPVIIHCVGYFNELIEIKKKIRPSQLWIIHGFRGKPELASQLLREGFKLSFGVKFNTKSVEITDLESLYIETDESKSSIFDIYSKIANIKMCNIEQLNAGFKLVKSIIEE